MLRITRRFSTKVDYKRCYELLEVAEGSDQERIRNSYISLVKKYHPDSGTEFSSVEKFHEIDHAFKALSAKVASEKMEKVEVEEQNIKHTAPQHRQYLSYDGFGVGNPFQREKQYDKKRAIRASHNVFKHRVEKATAEEHALMKKTSLKHDIKTKYGIDRLVEDLIQESMSKGEFTKLSGVGKPLKEKHNRNPYVDFITHKLNEVLIDNGFTPEWITLNKEIREELAVLRKSLYEDRKHYKRCPLNENDMLDWQENLLKYKGYVKDLNMKIDKFNLVVPILDKQLFHINLEKEAAKILEQGEYSTSDFPDRSRDARMESKPSPSYPSENLMGLIDRLFRK